MDDAAPIDEKIALIASEMAASPPTASPDDLSWAVVKMRAGETIVLNEPLILAYQAASSPHSIRALKCDLEAFDLWCRRHSRIALPATPETVADYLDGRADKGSKPASLGRYKASIAKIHLLARPQGSHAGVAGEAAPAGDTPPSRHGAEAGAAAAVQGAGPQR